MNLEDSDGSKVMESEEKNLTQSSRFGLGEEVREILTEIVMKGGSTSLKVRTWDDLLHDVIRQYVSGLQKRVIDLISES